MKDHRLLCILPSLLLGGCLGMVPGFADRDGGGPSGVDGGAPSDLGPAAPDSGPAGLCDVGKGHLGLGGIALELDRIEQPVGLDRGRLKPFAALRDEYARVLGSAPTSLDGLGATFGDAPATWYAEPHASAITIYAAYSVAFEGCLGLTASGAAYAAAPTPIAAATVCTDLATLFWSRAPSPAELDTCVQAAVSDTGKEPDPRRRWAYVCASLLTTADFLTY